MVTLVIDSFLSVWGISVFDAFSSKPLLPKFHAQFIRKDDSLLSPLVGWSSLYLKKSFILLFLFTFKCSHWSQLNEDLEGHIDFLAQTGPFSVPIRCVTKKCQVFSYYNHHPLTTQLWYCCATSWGYSLILHCASTTVKNIATSKMALIVTGCLERRIKGPFCGQNAYHSDFDNSSLLKRCSSWISPQSLPAKWSFEAEIVPLVSFCDETRKVNPFFIGVFYSYDYGYT